MQFENLDATKHYELVIQERFDPDKVKILRSMNAVARADIEEDNNRIRALTIAQSFQAWPAIADAVKDVRDGKPRNKIHIDKCVLFSEFDAIDPPWELTDDCDGRVFVAFMQFVREAHFDDETPYFRSIVVVPVDLMDTNNRKSREYYVFGVSREIDCSKNAVMDREWFLLSHFGVEGILPIRELRQRAEQRELSMHQRAVQKEIAAQAELARQAPKAEKYILKYQNRNQIATVRCAVGGCLTVLTAGGIVIMGFAAFWCVWVALAVVCIVSGLRIWYLHNTAYERAAYLAHPELNNGNVTALDSVRNYGYYTVRDHYYGNTKRVYVELDNRLR